MADLFGLGCVHKMTLLNLKPPEAHHFKSLSWAKTCWMLHTLFLPFFRKKSVIIGWLYSKLVLPNWRSCSDECTHKTLEDLLSGRRFCYQLLGPCLHLGGFVLMKAVILSLVFYRKQDELVYLLGQKMFSPS